MNIESIRLLGVRVDRVTTEQTLDLMDVMVSKRVPHQVVTVNPEFVIEAQRNRPFHVVIDEATLSLPDGHGLIWASRWLGRSLVECVTGSDILPLIAQRSVKRGYRLFLLGAAPGVAEKAAAALTKENPGLNIVGTYAGSPDPSEEEDLIARVVAAAPDFLFVAYGAPSQDLWIHRNLERLGVPVCMGIGGAFDFIAQVVPRAPLWMRKRGLEWLYRLIRQPWRWRRMLALPLFIYRVAAERLASTVRS